MCMGCQLVCKRGEKEDVAIYVLYMCEISLEVSTGK